GIVLVDHAVAIVVDPVARRIVRGGLSGLTIVHHTARSAPGRAAGGARAYSAPDDLRSVVLVGDAVTVVVDAVTGRVVRRGSAGLTTILDDARHARGDARGTTGAYPTAGRDRNVVFVDQPIAIV